MASTASGSQLPRATSIDESESQFGLQRRSTDRGSLRLAKSQSAEEESYLSELLSYSLDRLRKEPELLKQDSEQIKRRILETSVSQYEAFLSADQCLATLHANVHQLNQTLQGMRCSFKLQQRKFGCRLS